MCSKKHFEYADFNFSIPATYRIKVLGKIDNVWSDKLSGMQLKVNITEGQKPVTTLIGEVEDQAELSRLLESLYELHLPVISINLLNDK